MNDNGLKVGGRLLFSVGAVGKNMAYTLVSVYYMFYLTAVQGLSGTVVGLSFALSRLWDAVNDPIMGTIVDNTRTKWGKFRMWILLGTVINSVVLIVMFLDWGSAPMAFKYGFYLTLYVLWGMTYTLMDVPYWSMVPALCRTASERDSLSSISQLGAGLGSIVVMVGMPEVIFKSIAPASNPKGYIAGACTVAAVFLLFSLIMVSTVKERQKFRYEKVTLMGIIEIFKKNDQLKIYVLCISLYTVALALVMEIATFFFIYDLGDTNLETFGIFTLFIGVGMAAGMACFPFANRRLKLYKTYMVSILLSAAGFVAMFIVVTLCGVTGLAALAGTAFVIMFGFGWLLVLGIVMLVDIVDYGEFKTGKRTEGIIFSMQTFISKLGASAAALIVGIAVDLAGIKGADTLTNAFPPMDNPNGVLILRTVIYVLPLALLVLSLLVFIKKYRLHGKFHDEMHIELAKSRAAPG